MKFNNTLCKKYFIIEKKKNLNSQEFYYKILLTIFCY